MQILSAFTGNVFTVHRERLVPIEGYHPALGAPGQALALPLSYGTHQPGVYAYSQDSIRKGQSRVTALNRAQRRAWERCKDAARQNSARDAFTVNPAGAPFLDLIGRLQEVAEQPRPPMTFERAFPDTIPFDSGLNTVQADLVLWSGRPMVGWRNSLSDIPEFKIGTVSTLLASAWMIMNVPVTMQDAARSAISGATIGTVDRLALALNEFRRTIDYVRWFGNASAQIDGLLNHPFLSRYQDTNIVIGSGAPSSSGSSTSAEIYQSLIYVATYAKANTKGAGKVDTCLMSYKILAALAGQFITIGGTAVAKTLLDAVTEEYQKLGIQILPSDDPWWPLDDVGGSGVHGVLFYSREPQRVPAALQAMDVTAFPDQSNPLITNTYIVACIGDVHLRQAQSTLLAQYEVA